MPMTIIIMTTTIIEKARMNSCGFNYQECC
jgi:hypothetical protein